MILINFKIYKETFGDGAVKLAKICKKVATETGVPVIPVVSALDAVRIMKEVGIEVMLQSVDEYSDGAHSGHVSAQQAKELGIKGSLLNHSENKIASGKIKKILKMWPDKFTSMVCVHSMGQAETWAKRVKSDYVAYEPSYLIGDRNKSVATEKPEIIRKMAELFPGRLIVGAGVHSKEDVRIALSLGASGVLLATDVVKSKDPEKDLRELAEGFSV